MESILLLPIVEKGTDSRIGFGFRLGRHADIQTIFEIGPQFITKPLGMNKSKSHLSKIKILQMNYYINDGNLVIEFRKLC